MFCRTIEEIELFNVIPYLIILLLKHCREEFSLFFPIYLQTTPLLIFSINSLLLIRDRAVRL